MRIASMARRLATAALQWLLILTRASHAVASLAVQGSISDSISLDGVYGVAVQGNYLYTAAYLGNRLTVVDVTNPTAPTIAGSYSSSIYLSGAWDVVLGSSTYVYVSAYTSNRITVIDVANPSNPAFSGSLYNSHFSTATGLCVSPINPNIVFMASRFGRRLNAIDVVNAAIDRF